LTARVLGRCWLAVDDRGIPDAAWPPRGGRELLLLLLATPGQRLSRDRVLDTLWPELPADGARNAYYKALHSLRRVLEPDLKPRETGAFLVASANTVGLARETIQVDVDTFATLLDRAAAGPMEERVSLLRDALAAYGGALLEDEAPRDWLIERREWLHRRWQETVCQLAELELTREGSLTSSPMLKTLVDAEPTHEAAQRLLMRVYERSGQRDLARRQYERCIAALRDELDVDPSDATRRLGASLLEPKITTHAEVGPSRRWRNLPTPPARLIGREAALEQLQELLLESEARLLTLIGPGGVGKTRLALETAIQLQEEFRDGVCFVSLAPVRDEAVVLTTIAHALGGREERALPPLEQLCQMLGERQMLLVLDNVEHVLGAAPALADLLAACPELKIVATSREPLHLRAERLVEVPPLETPERRVIGGDAAPLPSLASLQRVAAVALFVERAGAAAPGFVLDRDNAAAVAAICARLDGLPLAIELAAARSRELPPRRLVTLLDDRMGTLVGGYRDLPPRQQTMRAAIAWSYDLLDAGEQSLFRRLSVFAGGCTPALVARMTGSDEPAATARLQVLVGKSLLRWRDDGNAPRAEMLETTREFGLAQLAETGELAAVRDLLTSYALELTVAAADYLSGPEQAVWLDRLDAEHDNLREALAWTAERGNAEQALSLGGALWRFWWSRGYLTEGREWLARALALRGPVDSRIRGAALNGAASLAESQGDFGRAAALHEEALALWRELSSPGGEARALSGLGTAAAHHGDYEIARGYHERALALVRDVGDEPGTARTLDRLGTLARHQGDLERAEDCYTESLDIFRANGDLVNAGIVLSNLGEVCHQQGRTDRAAALFEEALRLQRELDLPDGVAFDLTNLARVRLELGEAERAAALSAQATRLFRDMGNQLGLAGALAVFGMAARARGDPAQAVAYLADSLRILTDLDERSAIPEHLEMLAGALLDAGQAERAVRAIGAATALREAIASPPSAADLAASEQTLQSARSQIGLRSVTTALAAGRVAPLRLALAEALEGIDAAV
jgi:non-specific serine/threonine protein kinase